jgi:flagellar protein FliJ
MTRSEKLKPAARVAESREHDAARALGVSQRRLTELETKLEELYRYRDEYAERLARSNGSLDAGQLADFRAFLTRLNEAIAYQEARVHEARQEHEQSRGQWAFSRRKVDALGKVIARFVEEERHDEDRREQRDLDDRAQRRKARVEDDEKD